MGEVTKVEFNSPAPRSQATHIEQSRAIAEVQAAVMVAQGAPRDVARSVAQMRESCAQMALAEQAFFSFPRGGKYVSGPSIHLARELARCWGNIQYGVSELDRNDVEGRSEMQAWAWDVQTNTRSSHTFIVPHKRDKREGPEALTDMRDIYENNANQGARRVREAIFAVLPPWYTTEAEALCQQTLRNGGGKPLSQRIADAVSMFGGIGVAVDQLEESVGRVAAEWTAHDVTTLGTYFKSISRGEATVEELFPRDQAVTVDEIVASRQPTEAEVAPVSEVLAESKMTQAQTRRLFALLKDAGITDDRLRRTWATNELGREVESFKTLTEAEADFLIEAAKPKPVEGGAF